MSDYEKTNGHLGERTKHPSYGTLTQIASGINANVNFTYKMFNEQMDKTVMEAKGEIEAFCQNKLNSIAQAALVEHRDEFQKLENPVDIE